MCNRNEMIDAEKKEKFGSFSIDYHIYKIYYAISESNNEYEMKGLLNLDVKSCSTNRINHYYYLSFLCVFVCADVDSFRLCWLIWIDTILYLYHASLFLYT